MKLNKLVIRNTNEGFSLNCNQIRSYCLNNGIMLFEVDCGHEVEKVSFRLTPNPLSLKWKKFGMIVKRRKGYLPVDDQPANGEAKI